MRKALLDYHAARQAMKCDECKAASDPDWDEVCFQCIDNMPEYPWITAKPGKQASALYAYLKTNTDKEITYEDLSVHFGHSLGLVAKLVHQLWERQLVERSGQFVWAYEGRSLL